MMKADATEFDWDLVFVDEGQDWPGDEIAILNSIYGSRRLVVSDGVDQYVRESIADWSSGLPRNGCKARRLRRCLRMKANLAGFVADIALALRLDEWDLEPNPEAAGGRVIVVEGNLAAHPAWIGDLVTEARSLGNYPVDLLACVPPTHWSRGTDAMRQRPSQITVGQYGTGLRGTCASIILRIGESFASSSTTRAAGSRGGLHSTTA